MSGERSARRQGPARPQHRVVHIATAVAEYFVEDVEAPGLARLFPIDPGVQDAFAVDARGTGQRPSPRADDEALANERLCPLRADTVRADDATK
jgi:hypothetical protein